MEILPSKDPLKVACAFNPKLLEALAAYFNCLQPILALLLVSHARLREQKHQINHSAG
jgi:hypothetical protein